MIEAHMFAFNESGGHSALAISSVSVCEFDVVDSKLWLSVRIQPLFKIREYISVHT